MDGPILTTERLILRPWRDADLAPFALMNADPEVMAHFPGLLNRAESDAVAARFSNHFAKHGFGIWAVEERETGAFAGFTGLAIVRFEAHFTPAVEAGWRLARPFWGRGYATEAARAALAFGFNNLDLAEIVAYAVPANRRSRAVMDRLGMTHDPLGDFDHPAVPDGSPVKRHVLYRLRREDWG